MSNSTTSRLRVYCWDCRGRLYTSHDCGEDTCCCLYPVDNVPCYTCHGKGYWFVEDTPENRAELDSSLEEIEYAEESER